MPKDYISIHTHDRINFRRCRLRWNFRSDLRRHLVPVDQARAPLWFGTGVHFALEDFHGYRRFSSLNHAYQAYYNCYRNHYPDELPSEHEELLELGHGMLQYYPIWLAQRNEYQTLWIDGVPQVEVDFSIEIPELSQYAGKPVRYEGTFDRVVVDSMGRLWVQDYKTAKQFDTSKLETDAQVSAYCWAAEIYYGREVEGMLYLQMKKDFPKMPRITKQGLSVDKRQSTTYNLFRKALKEEGFDSNTPLPDKYAEYLSFLAEQETLEGDKFIRWDTVRRNQFARQFEYQNILLETQEMLDPDLPIYPNPTRDCAWDCDYRSVHLAMMDGSDWEWMIEQSFMVKGDERHEWLKKLRWEDPQLPQLPLLLTE